MSSKAMWSLPAAFSCTRAETQMPPGAANTSSRAATVHSIAEDVAVLDHDVAHVDPNAELDALVRRHPGITLGHSSLHLARTAQGIDHAAKFDKQAVLAHAYH